MPSPHERTRNNIRMGVFVTITLIASVGVIVILSGVWESVTRTTRSYTVIFADVSNLKSGAEVRVGGLPMGSVASIDPIISEDGGLREIAVDFTLDDKIQLREDAEIFVTSPVLGADAWLDIPKVGSGAPSSGPIAGAQTAGLLNTVLGPSNAAKANDMIDDAKQFSEFLARIESEYDDRIGPILANVDAASSDVREVTGSLRGTHWPQWARSVDHVMTWAASFTESVDAAMVDGHGLLTDARETVGENRDDVRSMVSNLEAASGDVRSITSHVNTDTINRVDAVLATGQEGLTSAAALLQRMQTDYGSWATDLGGALANASLASGQLKLTMTEVRRNPWKVLYRPQADELEHELLYDAARSFAMATMDLKAAAASAERVLNEHGELLRSRPDLLEKLAQNLIQPLDQYQKAQDRLFEVLLEDAPK